MTAHAVDFVFVWVRSVRGGRVLPATATEHGATSRARVIGSLARLIPGDPTGGIVGGGYYLRIVDGAPQACPLSSYVAARVERARRRARRPSAAEVS